MFRINVFLFVFLKVFPWMTICIGTLGSSSYFIFRRVQGDAEERERQGETSPLTALWSYRSAERNNSIARDAEI